MFLAPCGQVPLSETWADVGETDGKLRGRVVSWREQGLQSKETKVQILTLPHSPGPMI